MRGEEKAPISSKKKSPGRHPQKEGQLERRGEWFNLLAGRNRSGTIPAGDAEEPYCRPTRGKCQRRGTKGLKGSPLRKKNKKFEGKDSRRLKTRFSEWKSRVSKRRGERSQMYEEKKK